MIRNIRNKLDGLFIFSFLFQFKEGGERFQRQRVQEDQEGDLLHEQAQVQLLQKDLPQRVSRLITTRMKFESALLTFF